MAQFQDRIPSLVRAVDNSLKDLRPFREHRKEALDQYVGTHYSEEGADEKVPVNWIEIAVSIYRRLLVSSTPQVSVLTEHMPLRAGAHELELAVNYLLRKMRFVETLKDVVLEALFGVGIAKVGLADSDDVSTLKSAGAYYCDSVSLEDWVHDTSASRFEEVAFCGNRYRVPLSYVMEHPRFDKAAKDGLNKSDRADWVSGDRDEKAETLSHGPKEHDEAFDKTIELWDFYLPRENLMVTMQKESSARPLWVREWEGPERGPYHLLCFEKVPKNIMPLPPVALWMDIHDLSNRLFRKLGRQAERQKWVLAVTGKDTEDGKKLVNASDGEAITMMDPTSSKEIRTGGPDQGNMAFWLNTRTLFNLVSGNIESLGGLGAVSDTLGQDKMVNANAGARLQTMQEETEAFSSGIIRDLGWYLWEDPFIELPLTKRVPGTKIEVPFTFDQESKDGTFFDYNFEIIQHSLRKPTPQERLASINQVLTQIIIPLMPVMQQQGIAFDFEKYLKTASKYMHIPELQEMLIYAAEKHPGGEPVTSAKPAGTERRYVRENVSRGPTPEARDAQMAMQMAKAFAPQGGEG